MLVLVMFITCEITPHVIQKSTFSFLFMKSELGFMKGNLMLLLKGR